MKSNAFLKFFKKHVLKVSFESFFQFSGSAQDSKIQFDINRDGQLQTSRAGVSARFPDFHALLRAGELDQVRPAN